MNKLTKKEALAKIEELKKYVAEYRIGFVVGDKDVDQHFKEFAQAITQAMLDALPEKNTWIADHYESDEIGENATSEQWAANETIEQIRTAIKKMGGSDE